MRLILVLLALLATSPVSIKIIPSVLMPNGTVRVTCRVEPNEANRHLYLGITGYTSTQRTINGMDGPIYFDATFNHIDCELSEAFCLLSDKYDHPITVKQGFKVVCDSPNQYP